MHKLDFKYDQCCDEKSDSIPRTIEFCLSAQHLQVDLLFLVVNPFVSPLILREKNY
jgi:hypothetical protein